MPPTPHDERALRGLVTALQALVCCQDEAEILRVLTTGARRLADAELAALARRDGDQCRFVAEDAVAPRWHNRRVALGTSASGRAILQGRTLVIADVDADPDAGVFERGGIVRSLVVVPLRPTDPIGSIVVGWPEPHQATEGVARLLEALAESGAAAMANIAARSELELRLRDRWAELQVVNDRLAEAVIERRMAEEEARSQSLHDELTGLRNRRGFLVLAEQQLKVLKRSGHFGAVVFMDIDGLAKVNETQGHEAGDRLVAATAQAMAATVRESDVLGRVGGDEFALLLACDDPSVPDLVVARIDRAVATVPVGLSIGVAVCEPEQPATLDELLSTADAAMYRAKALRSGSSTRR
ncbi:MAG TPA: sensor domain-containing diguanylate cyclase [Acidimicrobiales bacterium]|nr:sensor domain-containing diguanylate cyclase [Acidimicrobiales bacterium]